MSMQRKSSAFTHAFGALAVALSMFVLLCGCMTIRATSIDEAKYLGQRQNPAGIYGRPGRRSFYSPFQASFDAMDRLMLVDFDDDPLYSCLELQVVDHPRRGKGAVVLLYRRNGSVDLYHTPHLRLDPHVYEAVSPGMAMREAAITYRLEVTGEGTFGSAGVTDATGRRIEVVVQSPAQHPAFAMLAPIGDLIKAPTMFPFFFMQALDFVHRSGGKVTVRIDGKPRPPATIPILVNGSRVYLARYSFSPAIAVWNHDTDTELSPIPNEASPQANTYPTYQTRNVAGHTEIERITWSDAGHRMALAFSPPIPDLAALRSGADLAGRFSASMDSYAGVFAGEVRIRRAAETVTVEVHPLEGWQPQFGKLWLATYHLTATLTMADGGPVRLKSRWHRD